MGMGAFVRAAGVGLVGSVISGILFRDLVPVAVGMAIAGVVAALVARGRPALLGLWAGQVAALGVLVAVQFGTTTNTVINSEDTGELLGLWPLVALIWIGFLASAAIGFGGASLIDRRVRPSA